MYTNPYKAYEDTAAATLSGPELEARVLSKAALKLKKCQENWDSDTRRAELEDAFEYNQRIWSIFQAELTKPDHPMDRDLRQNLLNLSIFIDKRMLETRAFPAPEKLTAIININNGVAAGLMSSQPAEN